MTVTGKNYSFVQTPGEVDTEYAGCNFTQASPHTRLFPGDDTPRTFTRCNLHNCDLPPGSSAPQSSTGHWVRDVPNDETITIMGESVVVEAFTVEA